MSTHTKFEVRIFSHFGAIIIFTGHVVTFPGSMRAKFEVRTFSHFGGISIYLPKI